MYELTGHSFCLRVGQSLPNHAERRIGHAHSRVVGRVADCLGRLRSASRSRRAERGIAGFAAVTHASGNILKLIHRQCAGNSGNGAGERGGRK
jgi:hypothetical protein